MDAVVDLDDCRVEFLDRISAVPPPLRAVADPFLAPGFLDVLEDHGAAGPAMAWQPRHLLLRDARGEAVGWMPLYLRQHSFGDFLRDWSWPGAWERLGHAYYPKLVTGLPYTPVSGPRLLAPSALKPQLIRAALAATADWGASSWHVAFPRDEDADQLAQAGLLIQPQVQFQWFNRGYADFDDFLASFAADKRRKVKADRRKAREAGVQLQRLAGHEVPDLLWHRLHQLYADTFLRYGNHPAISAECFAAMGETMGEAMQLFVANRDGRAVAVAICFRSNDTLYGRYWGAAEDVPGLHFELCYYQGIEYCIGQGLTRFEPGAGGEHKIARGFEPTRVVTAHWIADPEMRALLARHLAQVDGAAEEYRNEAATHLPFRRPA
ncbi:GNAT family N-acetyltransferase [Denitratisoma sp. agr-D3]